MKPLTAAERIALHKLAGGRTPAQIEAAVTGPLFTDRENDILRLLIEGPGGMLNKEIGVRLGITEGSVKVFMHRLARKLSTRRMGRTEIALFAERRWQDQSKGDQLL